MIERYLVKYGSFFSTLRVSQMSSGLGSIIRGTLLCQSIPLVLFFFFFFFVGGGGVRGEGVMEKVSKAMKA